MSENGYGGPDPIATFTTGKVGSGTEEDPYRPDFSDYVPEGYEGDPEDYEATWYSCQDLGTEFLVYVYQW